MDASKIGEIISEKTKRYNAILIDGEWGIGKTYEVDKCVKEDEEKRIYISLFGIESPSSIYKSLLWQFCSRDEKKDKIFKRLGNAFHVMDEKLSSASEKYGIASGILKGVASGIFDEKVYVVHKLSEMKNAVIIFDDMERINCSISMISLLGVFEEIKKHASIVVIANLDKMNEEHKNNLEIYSEKIFSKVYRINQCSSNINWEELGVNEGAKSLFEKNKQLLNLRVIQKGQYLYEDLISSLTKEYSCTYLKLVQKICYEVVVEDYLVKSDNSINKDVLEEEKIELIVSNVTRYHTNSEHIVLGQLIEDIYKFFLTGETIDEAVFYAESHIFDLGMIVWSVSIDEVAGAKKKIIQYIKEAKKVYELDFLAMKYIQLCNFTKQSYEDVLPCYKESMKKILQKISEIDYRYWIDKVDRESTSITVLEKAYEEVIVEVNKSNVDKMIEYLLQNTYDATAMQYAHWLTPTCVNAGLIDYLLSKGKVLINEELIPTKSNSYIEGEVRYSLIRELYEYLPAEMDAFMAEKGIDKLVEFRIDAITARKNLDFNGFELPEGMGNV